VFNKSSYQSKSCIVPHTCNNTSKYYYKHLVISSVGMEHDVLGITDMLSG
jgi:hypothetical protein